MDIPETPDPWVYFDQSAQFALGVDESVEWKICLHCERAYQDGWFKLVQGHVGHYEACPYPSCDGGAMGDGFDWKQIRSNHVEYPETPEMGVVYPFI